jgi:hypothetical protein
LVKFLDSKAVIIRETARGIATEKAEKLMKLAHVPSSPNLAERIGDSGPMERPTEKRYEVYCQVKEL